MWNTTPDSLYLARQITIDFHMCDPKLISDAEYLETVLNEAAKVWGATIIWSHFYNFNPIGASGVVILAESHFTVHAWPEHNYAAVDFFACGSIDFDAALAHLKKALGSQWVEITTDTNRWVVTSMQNKEITKTDLKMERDYRLDWESYFHDRKAWGIACAVDIYGCNPDSIRDSELIKRYVRELCEYIEMKRFWETQVVHFWEDERVAGYSMTQLIETSLISWHFANDTDTAYLDIFSCKYYNPSDVALFSMKFFQWKDYKLYVNLRM